MSVDIGLRRGINCGLRFRQPEYWPFASSGEVVTNAVDNSNLIYENFEQPLIEQPPRGQPVTTNFDSSVQQAEWASELLQTGSASLLFTADPVSGAARGTVARLRTSGSSAVNRFYPVNGTVDGVNIRGIRNGRVRVYYRTTASNTQMIALRFREKDKTTDYYEMQSALYVGQRLAFKVVGGVSTTLGSAAFANTIGAGMYFDGQWRWIEWTWWEGTDQYGTRLYGRVEHQDDGYVNLSGNTFVVDNSPSFTNEENATISILKYSNGNTAPTDFYVDEITVERWA